RGKPKYLPGPTNLSRFVWPFLVLALALGNLFANVQPAMASCLTDDGGPDDISGQKDLSEYCLDPGSGAIGSILTWQWDDTAWTGTNTGDACALYDTNNNGRVDFALCVTVTGSPAHQASQSPRLYTCTDSKEFNCTTATLKTASSTCTAGVVSNSDPFASPSLKRKSNYCSGTNCLINDTRATCSVATADLPATAKLID